MNLSTFQVVLLTLLLITQCVHPAAPHDSDSAWSPRGVDVSEVLLYHMTEAVIYGPGAFNGTYPSKDMATRLQVSTGAGGTIHWPAGRSVVTEKWILKKTGIEYNPPPPTHPPPTL